jgi:hypothetical protein
MRTIRDIAHSRAGDKGDVSNISVWAYQPKDFELLRRNLDATRIKASFANLVRGGVTVYLLPHLSGLNIVLENALEGGVNSSLNLDAHGKSWSFLVLELELVE